MSQLVYDHTQLVEPNLLIPGKKPIGLVKVDYGHPLGRYVGFAMGFGSIKDISKNKLEHNLKKGDVIIKRNNLDATAGTLRFSAYDIGLTTDTAKFTIILKVRLKATGEVFAFCAHTSGLTIKFSGVLITSSGEIRFYLSHTNYNRVTGPTITDTNWHTVVMVFDGSLATATERVVGCVDGVKYTGGANFSSTINDGQSSFYVSGYESGGIYKNGSNIMEYGYVFPDVALTEEQFNSVIDDPYQFLIPAG